MPLVKQFSPINDLARSCDLVPTRLVLPYFCEEMLATLSDSALGLAGETWIILHLCGETSVVQVQD